MQVLNFFSQVLLKPSLLLTLQQESSKDESCSVAGYLHQDLCHVSKGKDREDVKGGKKKEMLKRKANKNLFSPPLHCPL